LRKADLTAIREIEKQLKDSSERIADCVPKLEEFVDVQYAQSARLAKLPPKRTIQKKLISSSPPTPPP